MDRVDTIACLVSSEVLTGEPFKLFAMSLLAIVAGLLVSRFVTRFVHMMLGSSTMGEVSIFLNIVRAFVALSVAAFISENIFQVELGGLIQALGVTTLVVSLGLQDLIKNVVAGVQIVISHQFAVGDQLDIGTLRGEVMDISWRQTTMRDKDGDLHVIPNSSLMGAAFMHREGKMIERYTFDCDIKPGLDLDRVAADIERLADERLDAHRWRADEGTEVRFLESTANGVHASVRIFLNDIELTTKGTDAVLRAIAQRGYLADWTNDSPAQEPWY